MTAPNPFSKKRVKQPALANTEPPMAPPPPAPIAPPDDDPEPSGEQRLGRAIEGFTQTELTYVDEQMRQYMEILKRNPAVETFVNEAIIANIEMQRHDKAVELQRKKYKDEGNSGEHAEWFGRMEKIRSSLLSRYTKCLEALGALPKDKVAEADADECMSDVHLRYIEEIKARKARNQKVGEPSMEAQQLAADNGLNPAKYSRVSDVVSDADRQQIIEASDVK